MQHSSSKIKNLEFGAKRKIGEEQPERTLEYMRELRDAVYQKVEEIIKEI